MKLLVTGAAGFIGHALAETLCGRGDEVIGIDNINDYYDVDLKRARLARLDSFENFRLIEMDLAEGEALAAVFAAERFDRVLHMAAQAGVRYSLENPAAYINANLVAFANLLEGCRRYPVDHLVYASSSSVYGANEKMPLATSDNVDHPISLYAATKKSNELMAHCYSHLYGLPTTGLRFFTVYGPWGRPDMSPILFAHAITRGETIRVFNEGRHRRDFTYIDDIVEGVLRCLEQPPAGNPDWSGLSPDPASSRAPWRIYNIGRGEPVELLDYIAEMERAFGRSADKELVPAQPGDVEATFADIEELARDTGYRPSVSLSEGLARFADWYREYYGQK